MKKINIIFMFFLAFPLRLDAMQPGVNAPAFILNDTRGSEVNSRSLTGNVLFLNFWAPWCGSCRKEMTELEELNAQYAGKGLKMIAIAVGSSETAVAEFQQNSKITFPLLVDRKGSVSDAYQCPHLPTGYLISRDGVIRLIHKGYSKDSIAVYEKEIIELLNTR